MTVPEAIEEYKKNIIECENLNESLFQKEDKDEWILALHNIFLIFFNRPRHRALR